MNPQRQKPTTPWLLIFLFFIISISVVVIGFWFYNYQRQHLFDHKLEELSSISDLKIRQMTQWRHEKLNDASFLSQSTLLIRQFKAFSNKPENKAIRSDLIQILKSLTSNYDYKNILFLDPDGTVRLTFPNSDTLVGDNLKPLLPEIISNRIVVLSDLHKANLVDFVHLDLIIPLIDRTDKDSSVFGLLAIRINPDEVLYPLIQSWPSLSKTAEALIIRQEGDQIVYLNELRHSKNSALILKKSVLQEDLPAVMVLNGINSTINGIDYRGVPVIASMKKIPGSPWFMIAKIDQEEVLSSLDSQMTMIIVIIILFILATGSILGIFWWKQRVRFYRERFEIEQNRLALVKHFDHILKFANDIILLIDKNLNIVEANDHALKEFQYLHGEIIGVNINKILSPKFKSDLDQQIIKLNENGNATFESSNRRKDGTDFPIEISARLIEIEGEKYYQCIGRDITERKIAEDILKDSEERFRKIFVESPFSILLTGKDLVIQRANNSFCKMIGYQEEELKNFTFKNFTHPDYISKDEVSMMRLLAGEMSVYQTEKRYVRKDNNIIWGSARVSIIRNSKGEVQHFLEMVEDITLRKKAEAELEKSFSILKATLESTADGILVVDSNGRIVQYNQKFCEMWNIPMEVMDLGEDQAALSYVLDQLTYPDAFLEHVRKLYAEQETRTFDIIEFKDGRFFERFSQPQKIQGVAVGRVWSFRDITEREKAEVEIIAAKEKAEESDRLKTAFLHNISHEIRTPMNAIIGFTTLLNDILITEQERRQYIGIISQSGTQLLSIINDIVDISNIEAGQTIVNLKVTNLNSVLRSLNDQLSIKKKPAEVSINLNINLDDDSVNVITDNTKLVQVLSNLLNNAIKFTRIGRIDFGYVIKGDFLEFFVKDTGIGIPKEHQGKIFERFYQVDSTISRQYGGTGLGLSICKAYVELLGGQIWIDSIPGEGTTFFFTIKYKMAKTPGGN